MPSILISENERLMYGLHLQLTIITVYLQLATETAGIISLKKKCVNQTVGAPGPANWGTDEAQYAPVSGGWGGSVTSSLLMVGSGKGLPEKKIKIDFGSQTGKVGALITDYCIPAVKITGIPTGNDPFETGWLKVKAAYHHHCPVHS